MLGQRRVRRLYGGLCLAGLAMAWHQTADGFYRLADVLFVVTGACLAVQGGVSFARTWPRFPAEDLFDTAVVARVAGMLAGVAACGYGLALRLTGSEWEQTDADMALWLGGCWLVACAASLAVLYMRRGRDADGEDAE